jgi:uncharacterized protein (TIGR03435 family)
MILRALFALWTSVARPMGDHLWQSTLFVVLAAILVFALRKNQGRVRYWVWLTASVKFLIPFSLLIALGGHLAKPRVSTPAQAVVYSVVEDLSQPFAGQEMPMISEAAPSPAPVSRFHLLPPIFVAVWLGGIIVVLLVWATSWIRVSLMLRSAVPLEQGSEVEALRRLESSLGVRKPTKLVLSRNWMEPGIFGILSPVLIWPEGISQHLDDRHVEAILAHEICHARRHDNLTAVLHMLVEAVFWFHPLVWWMGARLEEERERACDEEVSLLCNQPHVYAESILRVCKFCSESPLACVSGITGADLKKRIVQIMTERVASKLDLRRKLLLLAASAAVVAAPLALGLAHTPLVLGQIMHVTGPLPSFEVATIRPLEPTHFVAPPGGAAPPGGRRVAPDGEQIISQQEVHFSSAPRFSDMVNFTMTAKMLIDDAYNLPAFSKSQTIGGPDWADQTMYRIEAKIDDSQYAALQKVPSAQRVQQIHLMEQSLLAERFKLKVHFETREMPVYALEVAKGGPKLTPSASNAMGTTEAHPTILSVVGKGDRFEIKGNGVSPGQLILLLQQQPELGNRMVVDQTGLNGHYEVSLNWTREGSAAADAGPTADAAAPSFFTALKEELGLQLVETKGPVEVIVIDHIEKPSVDGAEMSTPAPPSLAPLAPVQEGAAQTEAAPSKLLEFDVFSIKPSRQGELRVQDMPMDVPDGFNTQANPLLDLIRAAYGPIKFPANDRILGAPDWAKQEEFDIQAKVAAANVDAFQKMSFDQRRPMLQALLADRFKLKVHSEPRQLPIYELVVGKGGPKLKEAKPDDIRPNGLKDIHGQPLNFGLIKFVHPSEAVAQATSMASLAMTLSQPFLGLGRPVVDKTGLTGTYDFTLKWTPDQMANGAHTVDDSEPSIFTAIQEQLGLKLEPAKGPVEVLVIDHVEMPSPD